MVLPYPEKLFMTDTQANPRCFIDSNLWIYALIVQQDKQKATIAKQVIETHQVVVSTQVINEVCTNLLRKSAFPEPAIRAVIDDFYQSYLVITIDQASLLEASRLRERYGFSYWDSLIVACALQAGVTRLYSEDMQANLVVNHTLEIINPF